MSAMSQIPGYLVLSEAASKIGVSHAQASRYVKNNLIDFIRIGNSYLIPESAVESFERPRRGNPAFYAPKKKSRKKS